MPITQEEKDKILKGLDKALNEKGKKLICPICSNEKFALIEGYTKHSLQENVSEGLRIGGPTLPSAVIVCENCGNTIQFNLGVLGLLKGESTKNDEKK